MCLLNQSSNDICTELIHEPNTQLLLSNTSLDDSLRRKKGRIMMYAVERVTSGKSCKVPSPDFVDDSDIQP